MFSTEILELWGVKNLRFSALIIVTYLLDLGRKYFQNIKLSNLILRFHFYFMEILVYDSLGLWSVFLVCFQREAMIPQNRGSINIHTYYLHKSCVITYIEHNYYQKNKDLSQFTQI